MRTRTRRALARTTVIAIGLLASGCASRSTALRVEECGLITVSSPNRYVCNGKIYTAFELTRLRLEQAKKSTE